MERKDKVEGEGRRREVGRGRGVGRVQGRGRGEGKGGGEGKAYDMRVACNIQICYCVPYFLEECEGIVEVVVLQHRTVIVPQCKLGAVKWSTVSRLVQSNNTHSEL